MSNESQILPYRAEDGKTHIQVKLQGETVWLTQAQIAEFHYFGWLPREIPSLQKSNGGSMMLCKK